MPPLEARPLLPPGASPDAGGLSFETTPGRWFILFAYSFMSMVQCAVWFSFSSVPKHSKQYLGLSGAELDMLLNWGPILFIPVQMLLLYSAPRTSLRTYFVTGAALTFAATLVRAVPCLLSEDARRERHDLVRVLLHVGQVLNAANGPIVMSLCSAVSVTWFAAEERGTATGISSTANGAGALLSFLTAAVTDSVTTSANALPLYLLVTCVLAAVPVLCAIVYFPARPPRPPSAAAALEASEEEEHALHNKRTTPLEAFVRETRDALGNVSFMIVAIAGGVTAGTGSAWAGVLPQALETAGFSPHDTDLVGLAATGAFSASGVATGWILDRWFARRQKSFFLVGLLFASLAYGVFTILLPMPFHREPLIRAPLAVVVAVGAATGVAQGLTLPPAFEFSAELAFPVTEQTTGGLLQLINNVTVLIQLGVAAGISSLWFNVMIVAAFGVSFVAVACGVRERYHRGEVESRLLMSENE